MEVRALNELRADALSLEEKFIPRLSNFAARQLPGWNATGGGIQRAGLGARLGRVIDSLKRPFRAAILLPKMLRQARAVRRGPVGDDNLLIVNIASNRLPPAPDGGVREYLALLATEFPQPGTSATNDLLASSLRDATRILLVDPVTPSNYWARYKTCEEEDVVITDAAFLAVWLAGRFVRHPARVTGGAARVIRRLSKERSDGSKSTSLRRALAVQLLSHAVRDVCAPYNRTEAIFFTANSTLTEILREQQLRDHRCEQLVEVMHGIGSTAAERFFAAALEGTGEAGARHLFVPQLPGLPVYGVLSQRLKGPIGEIAVNTYLNRYLVSRTRRGDLEGFVRGELARIGPAHEDALILVFLGNNTNTGSFRTSALHRAECAMIEMAARVLRDEGREVLFIYVPHPALRGVMFDDPVFGNNDVRIYPDSVFTWLVADACVSIFSSSIFEAAFFCGRAFTPVIPEDDVFPTSYLDLVTRPDDSTVEGLEVSFARFLSSSARESSRSPLMKARERLPRTGWSWDG